MTTVSRVETFRLPPRWLFLRIETDDGLVGWGEPVLEGHVATLEASVHELADRHLIGRDATRVEDTWQVLTRSGFYRGGPVLASAVAGIDQALWDIVGKSVNRPVHALFGGPVRARIPVYAWVYGESAAEIADSVQGRQAQGFAAVKLLASGRARPSEPPAFVRAVAARAEAARAAVGEDGEFALDAHGRLSPALARQVLLAVAPTAPMFVEEPVVPELAASALPGLVASSVVPLAAGERAYSRWDFVPLLEAGLAVVQPDVSHAGGISECRRIAAQAEISGAALAPHCPIGPLALAASLQLGAMVPNFLRQEVPLGMHYNRGGDLLDYLLDPEPFRVQDGCITTPRGAGLGVDIDEAAVRRLAGSAADWAPELWRHEDGSLAEW